MSIYKERRQRLVKFIRDTQAKQIKGALSCGPNCFCILGLICEHFRIETGRGRWESADTNSLKFVAWGDPFDGYTQSLYSLPEHVMEYYGFADSDGAFKISGEDIPAACSTVSCLVGANDDLHLKFDQLAVVIEQEPEYMFVD